MLISQTKFSGIAPKISDPRLLSEGKSQTAVNCRFDHGGVEALFTDAFYSTPNNPYPLSMFLYQAVNKMLDWATNVSAITAPLANDSFHRVYYTETGLLKVTDTNLYATGRFLYPTPPPPPAAPVAVHGGLATFNPIGLISLVSGKVIVTETTGTIAGVSVTSSTSQLKITGTGIAGIDGVSFSFANATISAGTESFTLVGISQLSTSSIQSISKHNTGQVKSASHGLYTNDVISFALTGMVELNTLTATVTVTDSNNFTISIDTSTFTAFTGGTWSLVSRPLATIYSPVTILSITNTNPPTVTMSANHNLVSGAVVSFTIATGMTQLNNTLFQITVIDAKAFTLDNADSTLYGAFVSGTYTVIPEFSSTEDPTLQQTVYYVETYVNSYGSEGAPSPVSNSVDIYDGDVVALTDSNNSVDPLYGVVSKNIYRSNRDAAGTEVLQFLDNISLASASYTDSKLAANLGLLLPSAEWDAPPQGVEGLIALANQTLAAFQGNLVLFSVPGYPHAWPVGYQQPTDTPIMGIGSFGTTAIILTTGVPYLVTGNTPANYIMDKMGTGYGCVSKRSVVQVGGSVVYAAADGLVAMSPSSEHIITENLISPVEWQAKYNPSSIMGFYWEGRYVGFYTNGDVRAGFYIDPKTGDLIDLDFYATAGYHDPVTGYLYLSVNNSIVAFNQGSTFRTLSNMSRRYRFLPNAPGAVRILAKSYPVTITATYYGENLTSQTFTLVANSPMIFRHPQTGLVEECEITVDNNITAVFIASSIEEFRE